MSFPARASRVKGKIIDVLWIRAYIFHVHVPNWFEGRVDRSALSLFRGATLGRRIGRSGIPAANSAQNRTPKPEIPEIQNENNCQRPKYEPRCRFRAFSQMYAKANSASSGVEQFSAIVHTRYS